MLVAKVTDRSVSELGLQAKSPASGFAGLPMVLPPTLSSSPRTPRCVRQAGFLQCLAWKENRTRPTVPQFSSCSPRLWQAPPLNLR